MIKTLEFTAVELVEKLQRGEIPPLTCVRIDIEVPEETPVSKEAARKVAEWAGFVKRHSVPGATLDVSRESFYKGDTDW